MKLLGLIGGTSWVSTQDYYRLLNQLTQERLGGSHSAKLLLYSVDFEEFQPPTDMALWPPLMEKLSKISISLETAGAEGLVLCANTPHIAAEYIASKIRIPIIHIAEATAAVIEKNNLKKVALLGTRITMEQPFFITKLQQHNIEAILPDTGDRQFIHDTIIKEMTRSIFKKETKDRYLKIIDGLIKQGAEAVILGCTELPILIKPDECPVPSFDTTTIHVQAAVDFALSGN